MHGRILMGTDGLQLQINQGQIQQTQVVRIDHMAIIGVWDLAPLVK